MKLLAAPLLLALLAGRAPHSAPTGPALRRAPAPDSTTVRLIYGAASPDFDELMGRVLHVEKHQLLLRDRRLAGRRLRLTLQEYRLGQPGPEKPLDSDPSLLRLDSAGRLQLTVYARASSATTLENLFLVPRAGLPRTFAAVPGQAERYSLRFDIHPLRRAADQSGAAPTSPAQEFKLPVGSTAILAVYTLPYEQDGYSYYCNLAQSRVPVAEWYSHFKVPHFVVYRARFE